MCGGVFGVCGVCGVCRCGCAAVVVVVVCVCGVVWQVENPRVSIQNVPVCRFETHPCVLTKRAHVEHTRAFCRYTRMRFEPTHGDVFNLHTGGRKGEVVGVGRRRGGGSLLSLSLFPSLFLSSVVLFLFSLSLLSSRSCRSLSNNDNDHSSGRAPSVYTRL